jgi:Zn-dependent M28 family amino/carboxypeptidase
MSERERASIGLNINLDTVGGDSRLTALTSEFPRLDAFVRDVARQSGFALGTYLPTMANSDHFNFARYGIPALRLVAGFDEPRSNIRHVLTRGDTRDKVDPQELPGAARIAATVAWRALMLSDADLQALRER